MTQEEIQKEVDELIKKLGDPKFLSSSQGEAKKTGARLQRLQKLLNAHEELAKVREEQSTLEELRSESPGSQIEIIAEEEELNQKAAALEEAIAQLESDKPSISLPSDIIMEIRAGAGGDEASLFAEELFSCYNAFAERRKWEVAILSKSESEAGGFKEIIFEIDGKDAYKTLKFESGVHRVQRIPTTEKQGRIHTSTVSVAVLPKVQDIDIEIRPQDLKLEFSRSSGAGGQNVNKVETAVRIIHLPTGVVVTSQEGRSQQKNRERAMSILRARLYEARQSAEEAKMAAERKSQIGTGDRSEKIRTYNFPQDRITDHRVNQSFHNIEKIMAGHLDDIIEQFKK